MAGDTRSIAFRLTSSIIGDVVVNADAIGIDSTTFGNRLPATLSSLQDVLSAINDLQVDLEIDDGSLITAKFANRSVTGLKIALATIADENVTTGGLSGNKLRERTIPASKIEIGAIGGDELANSSVTGNKITDGTITGIKIGNSEISLSKLSQAVLNHITDVGNIADGSITRAKLSFPIPAQIPRLTRSEIKTLYEANLNTNAFTDNEKTRLGSVMAGAEANVQIDWNSVSGAGSILNKPLTITNIQSQAIIANSAKRTYPITASEKLARIADGAEVNVQSDWNATTGSAFILNKPTIPIKTTSFSSLTDTILARQISANFITEAQLTQQVRTKLNDTGGGGGGSGLTVGQLVALIGRLSSNQVTDVQSDLGIVAGTPLTATQLTSLFRSLTTTQLQVLRNALGSTNFSALTGSILITQITDGLITEAKFSSQIITKLNRAIPTLDTASQLLTKIKTVDGSGSGLDAELLDGRIASNYLNDPDSVRFTQSEKNLLGNLMVSNISGLQAELDARANIVHTHSASDIISGIFPDTRIPATITRDADLALSLATKQDVLTAGENVSINGSIISVTSGGGTPSTSVIMDGSITLAKLATGSVNSDKIVNGSIRGIDIASDSLIEDNYGDGTITGIKIVGATISADKLDFTAITSDDIINDLVTSDNAKPLSSSQGVILKSSIDSNITAIATKQNILEAGDNITITGNTISSTGSGAGTPLTATQLTSLFRSLTTTQLQVLRNALGSTNFSALTGSILITQITDGLITRAKLAFTIPEATPQLTQSEVKTLYEANLNTNAFTDTEKTKLGTVMNGAEANVQIDWNSVSGAGSILNKPLTITNIQSQAIIANSAKRTYPITASEKLARIADGAEVNVQSDWNATTGSAFILNKPTIPIKTTSFSSLTDTILARQISANFITEAQLTQQVRTKLNSTGSGGGGTPSTNPANLANLPRGVPDGDDGIVYQRIAPATNGEFNILPKDVVVDEAIVAAGYSQQVLRRPAGSPASSGDLYLTSAGLLTVPDRFGEVVPEFLLAIFSIGKKFTIALKTENADGTDITFSIGGSNIGLHEVTFLKLEIDGVQHRFGKLTTTDIYTTPAGDAVTIFESTLTIDGFVLNKDVNQVRVLFESIIEGDTSITAPLPRIEETKEVLTSALEERLAVTRSGQGIIDAIEGIANRGVLTNVIATDDLSTFKQTGMYVQAFDSATSPNEHRKKAFVMYVMNTFTGGRLTIAQYIFPIYPTGFKFIRIANGTNPINDTDAVLPTAFTKLAVKIPLSSVEGIEYVEADTMIIFNGITSSSDNNSPYALTEAWNLVTFKDYTLNVVGGSTSSGAEANILQMDLNKITQQGSRTTFSTAFVDDGATTPARLTLQFTRNIASLRVTSSSGGILKRLTLYRQGRFVKST